MEQDKRIRLKDFQHWLENPVTRELQQIIESHIVATKTYVAEIMFNCSEISKVDLTEIAEYRGNLKTLEFIQDLKSFLSERLEEESGND